MPSRRSKSLEVSPQGRGREGCLPPVFKTDRCLHHEMVRFGLLCVVAACHFDHGFGPGGPGDDPGADGSVTHVDAATGAADAPPDGTTGTSALILRPTVDSWLRQQFP